MIRVSNIRNIVKQLDRVTIEADHSNLKQERARCAAIVRLHEHSSRSWQLFQSQEAKANLHRRRGCLVPDEHVDCIDLLAEGRSGRGMLLPQVQYMKVRMSSQSLLNAKCRQKRSNERVPTGGGFESLRRLEPFCFSASVLNLGLEFFYEVCPAGNGERFPTMQGNWQLLYSCLHVHECKNSFMI